MALDQATMDIGTSLLSLAAQHGLPGITIGLLAYWVWTKDKEITKERDARIADAKAYTEMALKLQAQAISAVDKLTDIFEELKKLMAEKENARITGNHPRRPL